MVVFHTYTINALCMELTAGQRCLCSSFKRKLKRRFWKEFRTGTVSICCIEGIAGEPKTGAGITQNEMKSDEGTVSEKKYFIE